METCTEIHLAVGLWLHYALFLLVQEALRPEEVGLGVDGLLVVEGEGLGVYDSILEDAERLVANFEVMVLDGIAGEEAIGAGVNTQAFHELCL